MELKRAGKLVIYGSSAETDKFRITIDDGARQEAVFVNDVVEFDLPAGGDTVKVKLEKSTGSFYPRFKAVLTK